MPGGSSGGSAAAVAAGEAALSLGTDTAGSIRQPAAFCGVVGIKPTYGRVSRYGLIAFASSLDCPGPVARTVRDAALMLQVIAGADPHDATAASVPVPDYLAALEQDVRGLRIGLSPDYFRMTLPRPCDRRTAASSRSARRSRPPCGGPPSCWRAMGAEIVEDVPMPNTHYGIPAYFVISPRRGRLQPAPLRRGEVRLPLPRQPVSDLQSSTASRAPTGSACSPSCAS